MTNPKTWEVERQRLIEEIGRGIPPRMSDPKGVSKYSKDYLDGYNQALSEVKEILEKMKSGQKQSKYRQKL